MASQWGEPTYNKNNGYWHGHVEGLTHAQINALYAHEVCRGAFVFPDPRSGKATPTLNYGMVAEYGAVRCWWLVREDVLDAQEREVELSGQWERALGDALSQPNGYREDEDDELSAYGTI